MKLLRRIVIYLIRKRFRLRKYQLFRFKNQKTIDTYYFGRRELKKIDTYGYICISNVSLNWLLSDECEIINITEEEEIEKLREIEKMRRLKN